MQIIPVLDILDGVVVHGIAGQRDTYRPVESVIALSAHPLDVAEAFRETFGFEALYVADLDAIAGRDPNFETYRSLADAGFRQMIDCGLKNAVDAEAALMAGAEQVIAALETWPLLSSLEMLVHRLGSQRVVFSLDLKNGVPLRRLSDVVSSHPADIGAAVLEAGVQNLIVLDLAAVGVDQGVSTLPLCEELIDFAPRTRIITGGGVRSTEDLKSLAESAVHGVLVASALHSGAITASDLVGLGSGSGEARPK